MDVLAESVESTLKNLKGKRDFLAEQRGHYIDIRSRLVSFNSADDDDNDGERAKSQGMVFGDIIISASRIYLSIGYEYYVEKTKEEAITFVDDKLKLMDSAVEQFDMKIQEALTTLENLNGLDNEVSNEQGEAENEEGFLPSIEIREELDEEGNVISSSVTPTTKQASKSNTKEEAKAPLPQKEQPTKEKKLNSFEENLKGKLSKEATKKKVVEPSKVDTENVYTFADLVQQMDQQDELDDGSIGADDINYDYDSFENSNFEVNGYDEDDEDDEDEDDDYLNHSIIPGFEAQSSFLSQIQQLRAQNRPQEHEQNRTKGNKPLKPILKKSSADEEPTKKEKTKRVGFASSLEIHEVENLKDETKKQTHSFNIPMYDIINNQEIMGPADEMVSDEFDGDLLAKMLGVHEADEVHDKYKNDVAGQEKHAEESSRSNKKNRVSRFKKDRAPKKPETLSSPGPVERESAVSDIVERRSVVNDVIEKEPVVSDIMERKPTAAGTSSKSDSALKKKDLKSLQKPRSTRFKKKKFDPKIFDDISDDEPEVKPEPNPKRAVDVQEKFPSKIQEVSRSMAQTGATAEDKPVRIANVDYHALGGDMDDMVKAYSLGIYDDDLDEDPGTVVEKLEDFKEYNRQVELLRDEIRDFQLENPPVATEEEDEHDGKIMADVVEREVPESYADDEDEVALHPDRLHEAVAIEYRRLKETAASKWQSSPTQAEGELEPIDEFGNPVKTSRFRSQRLRMGE